MPVGNVDPNPSGETTLAYSRADLVGAELFFNTDVDGYSPLIPHGMGQAPAAAGCTVTDPSGGGLPLPGPHMLTTCDATNLQFRFFANDGVATGTPRQNRDTTIRWWAFAP